jgi:hypothetical protein
VWRDPRDEDHEREQAEAEDKSRIGGYVCGPTSTVTVDGAPDDARVVFKSAGVTKWQLTSLGGAFIIYNGAFSAGVYLAMRARVAKKPVASAGFN